ncbi:hypothetical protein ElyMa_002731600 [Elysia marginata]|uniref:UbiC transcription regulator-associated domain-containing protein n=1 Tax=Elysia marginata TaxID=1093978 RepID=A0AAV4HHJ6_9GAST|nr:hypothetical protein ElyMa_002731600 [Elysia marginata]
MEESANIARIIITGETTLYSLRQNVQATAPVSERRAHALGLQTHRVLKIVRTSSQRSQLAQIVDRPSHPLEVSSSALVLRRANLFSCFSRDDKLFTVSHVLTLSS